MSAHDCPTLHALVGQALRVEKLRLEYEEVRGNKRKRLGPVWMLRAILEVEVRTPIVPAAETPQLLYLATTI